MLFRTEESHNKKDTAVISTKHLILTFSSPTLPQIIKAGYLNCKIRPYIPNHLRYFKCQRFRHSHTSCNGQLTCSRCASVGHVSTDCILELKCINCSQAYSADSKLCSKWRTGKEIQIQLLPFTSSVTVTSSSKSQSPVLLVDTAPTISDSLFISGVSSSSTACPLLQTTTTSSNTIPPTSQDAKITSKPLEKRPPKNICYTIKPKINIKMAPHKSRKLSSVEYTTDEEDIMIYDIYIEEEVKSTKSIGKMGVGKREQYSLTLTPTHVRNSLN
ncbi:uncharacterized protein TNCV_296121 [Trichonephila clavipes]|nr:uncharacterized protein TNCV_296121 [Trichonephila clavipes]